MYMSTSVDGAAFRLAEEVGAAGIPCLSSRTSTGRFRRGLCAQSSLDQASDAACWLGLLHEPVIWRRRDKCMSRTAQGYAAKWTPISVPTPWQPRRPVYPCRARLGRRNGTARAPASAHALGSHRQSCQALPRSCSNPPSRPC